MLEALKKLLGLAPPRALTPEREADLALPFRCLIVDGANALIRRVELQAAGLTPVIMGAPDDASTFTDLLDGSESMDSLLTKAEALDIAAWSKARVAEQPDYYAIAPEAWPAEGAITPMDLMVHLDVLSRKPLPEVVLGLIPTGDAWKAPGYVRYGGWNDCPNTEVHLALWRKWSAEYGAKIACMSAAIIQCTVERPPATREAAMMLAREQFIYCPDLIHQGLSGFEVLAATLMKSRAWYFWWD
jgi:hypothetical protein